jgi:lysophospholipase L1-like esterase
MPMRHARFRTIATGLVFALVGSRGAAEAPPIRPVPKLLPGVERTGETVVRETWDWAAAMIPVAKKFTGRQGQIVLLGDSLTYANQSTRWAWSVPWNRKGAYTEADKAILRWSHAYETNKPANGWWLAKVDRPGGRSETAASGIRTNQYVKGGFHGLPPLAEIIAKYNPQVAFILLGTNDATGGRKPADVLNDMNTIVEMLLANGTIPVLTTPTPLRSKAAHERLREYNGLYLRLAAARKVPIIDLYGEAVSRQPGGKWDGTIVGRDGVHLTHKLADGPPTESNLANCGYLLRCYLTVQKLKQVKEKVIDKAAK